MAPEHHGGNLSGLILESEIAMTRGWHPTIGDLTADPDKREAGLKAGFYF
jgi:hypothetical protein